MELLKDYTDDQVRDLARTMTRATAEGPWTLTGPDGKTWTADSPMKCVRAEMSDRIPPLVALARIKQSLLDAEEY